jgi:hypothetical protein
MFLGGFLIREGGQSQCESRHGQAMGPLRSRVSRHLSKLDRSREQMTARSYEKMPVVG